MRGVTGGGRAVVPARWRHAIDQSGSAVGRYLSFAEREEIAILRAQGVRGAPDRASARPVPATISRELRRNAATRGGVLDYRASTAQWHADRRAGRPKLAKLAGNDALREYVQDRLAGMVTAPDGTTVPGPKVRWIGRRHGRRKDRRWARSWSPEQIADRLRVDFPDDGSMRISHEAIYQALYVQGRGALRRELTACLRTGRALRVPTGPHPRARQAVRHPGGPDQRATRRGRRPGRPGHWEGDLILGLGSSAIGTLVERTTRFTMLLHLPRMDGHGDQARVQERPGAGRPRRPGRPGRHRRLDLTLPEQLRRSLTWDQGAEMAQHAQLRIETGLQVYFC